MKNNKLSTPNPDRSRATHVLHHAYLQFLGVLVNRPAEQIAAEFHARLKANPAMARLSSHPDQHLN